MGEYQNGYAAGRRKRKVDGAEAAFWQRAFIASLPATISSEGWKRGGIAILGISDRVKLARDFADEALKQARLAGKV